MGQNVRKPNEIGSNWFGTSYVQFLDVWDWFERSFSFGFQMLKNVQNLNQIVWISDIVWNRNGLTIMLCPKSKHIRISTLYCIFLIS